jgi:hypothetical protein
MFYICSAITYSGQQRYPEVPSAILGLFSIDVKLEIVVYPAGHIVGE